MSTPRTIPIPLIEEGQRMMSICNACRYCEGYCAVFPALERRLSFSEGDLAYLSNLCHNCGACYYSCQYAPPHEFQLNFPKMLANVRLETYRKYAWPAAFAGLLEGNGAVAAVSLAAMLTAALLATGLFVDRSILLSAHADSQGAFYAVIPHSVMATTFGVVFLLVVVALVIGSIRFWADMGEDAGTFASPSPFGRSIDDALRLRYLAGGGDGCMYPSETPSGARRRFHHFTFYGFMLCFAATFVATVYHYVLGWKAPYPCFSVPVILGTVGGVGLLIGSVGLLWIKRISDTALSADGQTSMDVGFLVLLFLVSATGLLLLALRESAAMGILLALHLGTVMALFITMPYGKFVHGVYRFTALVRFHVERRRPVPEMPSE